MKILVIRNDKLGDFMLIWPALALLRAALPQAQIVALLPKYTRELGEECPYIDAVIVDENITTAAIAQWQFDVQITFFSSKQSAKLGRAANIPIRIAPATKYWQFYYNHRVVQRRSRSLKPEYQYNIDLVSYLLALLNHNTKPIITTYWQPLTEQQIDIARQQFLQTNNCQNGLNIIIHPGCGGSANNLSVNQYAQLIDSMANQLKASNINFILSAGPDELHHAQQLRDSCNSKTILWHSQQGLLDYAYNLAAIADVFIAGSTGTLHLAGVLDKATVGFYPATKACCALRWRPCSARHLAISANQQTPNEMHSIDMHAASIEISNFINNLR